MLTILGNATRSVTMLNRWLALRGCPQYAGLYQVAGLAHGVRWDMAIFQSIKETGWWKFGGDVKPSQNNFAGIGASGGGVTGDSFPSPMAGITAQIQNLALRAGRPIAEREIISPYVRKNYDFIRNRNTPFWEQLSGTWATDPNYFDGIAAIAKQFDDWLATQDLEASVTWFEFNLTPEGLPVCVAYAGEEPKTILVSADKSVVIDFWNRHPNARTFRVAPAGKAVPGVPEYNRGGEPEPTPPTDRPLAGISIGLDPGHSLAAQGASGTGSRPPSEYMLNVLASQTRLPLLKAAGASAEIYDPNPDSLSGVGHWGGRKRVFISDHHNATDRVEHGSEIYVPTNASGKLIELAEIALAAVCAELGTRNRGVKKKNYTVIHTAGADGCPFPMLFEHYFVDAYSDMQVCMDRTARSARASTNAIIASAHLVVD